MFRFVLGLVSGVAIGVAAAGMSQSQSGQDLRAEFDRIRNDLQQGNFDALGAHLEERFKELQASLEERFAEVEEQVAGLTLLTKLLTRPLMQLLTPRKRSRKPQTRPGRPSPRLTSSWTTAGSHRRAGRLASRPRVAAALGFSPVYHLSVIAPRAAARRKGEESSPAAGRPSVPGGLHHVSTSPAGPRGLVCP